MAVGAASMAQEASTNPLLMQKLGKDEIEETVQVSLGLTGQPAGELHVDYFENNTSDEMTFPQIYKPQRYELQGYARMKPGKRVKVEGRGILLAQSYLTEAVNRPTALGGFLTVWQGVMRDITRADPDAFSAHQINWQMPGTVSGEELVAAEKRLGARLPSFYRETVQRSGPWQLSLFNGFSFELLAPSQLVSASDWLQRHYGPAEWDSPENQARRQQFKSDIVFAVVNNEPWVLRRSGTPCADEQPSFAVGHTADEKFYVEADVCGGNQQLEALRQKMLEAMNRALVTPDFTVVGDGQRLYFVRGDSPEKKILRLYLKAGH
ncbi:MAG: hypothetical protein FWC42_07950 [Proteobacteria bacterium]|nr:hypothetical protein [Pseudomonadota bacterium]